MNDCGFTIYFSYKFEQRIKVAIPTNYDNITLIAYENA